MVVRAPYARLVRHIRATLVGGLPSEEDHNIWNWFAATALVGVIDGGMWVFLPVFLARLDASPALLGLYNSLPALIGMLLLVPGGMLADRTRDQHTGWKWAGMVVRLLYVPVVLAPFFVPRMALPLVIVAIWTLRTIPDAVSLPLWMAVASRAVSPARRAHINGTRWALLSITSAICQALFGRWLDVAPFPGAYQIVFAIGFMATLVEWFYFGRLRVPIIEPELREGSDASLGERLRAYLRSITDHRPFVRFLAATFAYRVALSMPAALFTLLWVRELRASNSLIGLQGTVGYGALVLGYLVWGRNANRLGHQRVLRLAAWGVALYVVVSAFLPTAAWIVPVAVLWGLTISGIDVGLFDLLLHACPPGKEARFSSVAHFAGSLAIFAGPLLGVALANATSVRAAIAVAGALQFVGTVGFVLLPKDV